MTATFASPSGAWTPLSKNFLPLKRLTVLSVYGIELLLVIPVLLIFTKWWITAIVALLGLLWVAWRWWRMAAVVAARGYQQRDTDLYIRRGLWFRSVTVVPYGRMQMVEMQSGPIERRFGMATLQLITAAAMTNAVIEGLDLAVAEDLRDRLTELGESQAVGL